MECDNIKILLSGYLDGELDPSETRRVERHLESCPSCRRDLEALKDYLSMAKNVERMEVPEELMEKTFEKIHRQDAPPLLTRIIRKKEFQLVSTLAAAAVIILFLTISPNILNTSKLETNFAYQEIKRGKGPAGKKGIITDESKEVMLLQLLTAQAGGEVIKEDYNDQSGMTDNLLVRIPKKNYASFRQGLIDSGIDADIPGKLSPMSRYVSVRFYFPGRKFLVGDMNGDGRSDMAAYFKRGRHSGQWYVSFHQQEARFKQPARMNLGDSLLYLPEFTTPLCAHINGDSLSDIILACPDTSWAIFINKDHADFQLARINIPVRALPNTVDLFVPLAGDFNGDGLDDAAVHYLKGEHTGQFYVSFNQGTEGFGDFIAYPFPVTNTEEGSRYLPLVLDFNGDGYDDAGIYWQSGVLNASWLIGLNNKLGGFLEPFRVYFGNSPLAYQGDYLPFTGDFNGDGYDDMLVKSGTQDETGEWIMEYNEKGYNFTYGYNVSFNGNIDFILK